MEAIVIWSGRSGRGYGRGICSTPSHELSSLPFICSHDSVVVWFNDRCLGSAVRQLQV